MFFIYVNNAIIFRRFVVSFLLRSISNVLHVLKPLRVEKFHRMYLVHNNNIVWHNLCIPIQIAPKLAGDKNRSEEKYVNNDFQLN